MPVFSFTGDTMLDYWKIRQMMTNIYINEFNILYRRQCVSQKQCDKKKNEINCIFAMRESFLKKTSLYKSA